MVVEDEESSHDGDCPRFWDDLHTAEDIAAGREMVMVWAENAQHHNHPHVFPDSCGWRETVQELAAGITARAVELGLEAP